MRYAIYVKFWKRNELDPATAKLGVDWWVVNSKRRDRRGLDFIFPFGRLELTFTSNRKGYEKDIEKECRGVRIL